jgi:predicted dehydrogenase
MTDQALPVAVIGAGGVGSLALSALRGCGCARLVGLSDRDPKAAEAAGKQAGVSAFTDNRSLLAETHPAAVFLAVPPAAAKEIVLACAERGIHVWKEAPLARDLDDAVAMVRPMEKAGLKLAVGCQRRFAGGYRRAWELRHELGQVFLGRGHYLFNWGPHLGWRADKASAGGGALLELGYHPIDLLVWMLGLPEEVYGLATQANADPPRAKPLGDTDDTAAGVMRFAGGAIASVVTTRSSGPASEQVCLHGQRGSIAADVETCVLRDADGNVLDSTADQAAPLDMYVRQVQAFARAVTGAERHYESSALEGLLTQATIEAMYLSDRTLHPESPARLLQSHALEAGDCLRHRPLEELPPPPELDGKK